VFSVHVTTNHNCAVIKNTPEIKIKIKTKNQLLPGSFAKTEVHVYFFTESALATREKHFKNVIWFRTYWKNVPENEK
jgi:hypothetical protein